MDWTVFTVGVLTAAASLAGSWLADRRAVKREERSFQREREREDRLYQRERARAAAERLRRLYTELAAAALAAQNAAGELMVLWAGDTHEQRNARVAKTLEQPLERVNAAMAPLQLEGDVEPVLEIWHDLWGKFFRYRIDVDRMESGEISGVALYNELKDLQAAVSALLKAAREHLDSLQ